MIGVVAKLEIQENKVDEAIALIKALMAQVASEEGTLAYTLNQNAKKPNELVIMERYTDKAALAYHSSTDHFKQFNKSIAGLLAAKPAVDVLAEIHTI